jgi:microsomal dipeptidase-like Zn-dependent dipeptidase
MAQFDLHCHPTSKCTIRELDIKNCPAPIDPLNFTVDPTKLNGLLGVLGQIISGIAGHEALERIMGDPLDSQCSFRQLEGGSLVSIVLIAVERAYTEIRLLEAINEINPTLFANIKNSVDSFHKLLVDRELFYINKFNNMAVGGRKFRLINTINDYPVNPDPNTVYGIVSIEGGHNFYTIADQAIQELDANMLSAAHSVSRTLRAWKQDPQRPRLFYTTVTHHAQNKLSNHCWAIPAFFTSRFEDSLRAGSFTPTGNGLTRFGMEYIHTALTVSDGEKRVLIDVKHMSTVARNQAYEYIKQKFPGTPLIASHVGVNGMSWKDQPRFVDSMTEDPKFPRSLFARFNQLAIRGFMRENHQGHLESLTFNGWSLNLFDEDIIEIMASGGLIGVQFEPRVLGVKGTQVERFSKREYNQNWGQLPVRKRAPGPTKDAYTFDPLTFISGMIASDNRSHRWYFCQTIMHLVLVVTREKEAGNPDLLGIDPWEHICLGTDYDGLITALSTAPTADRLDNLLNQETIDCLQAMAVHLNNRNNNFGGQPIIVPFDVLSRLKIGNGVNFLRTHFI